MLTNIMKWVSSTVLLLAGLRLATPYQVLLELVVCASALLVLTQAVRVGKYMWATGFLTIAVLFNPIVPMILSRKTLLWLDWVCLMTFMISLWALKRQPILSMPSITNRVPGSESL
jgi:uncharacterized protein DUF6804